MLSAPKSKDEADDEQLLRMCDYGASRHRIDQTLIPRFRIMPCEIDKVRARMAALHADVPYQLEYPTGQPR